MAKIPEITLFAATFSVGLLMMAIPAGWKLYENYDPWWVTFGIGLMLVAGCLLTSEFGNPTQGDEEDPTRS